MAKELCPRILASRSVDTFSQGCKRYFFGLFKYKIHADRQLPFFVNIGKRHYHSRSQCETEQ